jgi:hypothetical protein
MILFSGPIQLSIEGVSGTVSVGVKRRGYEDDHSSLSSIEIMKAWNPYLHSYIHLHIVELK